MESLLTVVLVIFIFVLLLVVFIPAYLERRSRANRALREQYTAELRALERDGRRLERTLIPYTRTRSAAYQEGTAVAVERLRSLMAGLDDVGDLLTGLRCPTVYGYLLPAQHFMVAPADAGDIVADARRLRRARAGLVGSAATAASAQEAIDALAALPEQLAADRLALARRLSAVETAIHSERDEGIEALDDLTQAATGTRRLLREWEKSAAPEATLTALDGGAAALESAASTLAELEARVADVARERSALDERLRQAAADLDDIQASTKSGARVSEAPPQVGPLLRRAAALLNGSAPAHRSRREFDAAGADATAAARLIAMGRDLTAADQSARLLEERDDGVSLSDAIAGVRRELTELLDRLEGESTGDGPVNSPAEAALAGRAAQTRARAEMLARQQDEVIAGLEREADATRERLERAWAAGQHLLRLAGDDPLTRRYARLQADFQAAQRQPAALEQFRRDVAGFEGVLGPWVTRVQETRGRVGRLRERLPVLIDAALATAGPWNCLAGDVTFIQQRAADFETTQARFTAAHYRRETESLMDQLAAIENDVEERFDRLNDRAGRLCFLEEDVGKIFQFASEDVAAFPADHPERVRLDKALKLIDHHSRSAHAATSYEDASVALLRAADVANKIAL